MTRRHVSVVGDPIEHSLSPLIHRIVYGELGLDWVYEKHRVAKGQLANFIERHPEYSGFSVTMPLKEEAFQLAASLDFQAEKTKVVNTLSRNDGSWEGFNTDVFGLTKTLGHLPVAEVRRVAILGYGASASSALAAVEQLYPSAEALVFARDLAKVAEHPWFSATVHLADLADIKGNFDLVINTTPVNQSKPSITSTYWMNINYSNSLNSPEGSQVISGLDMLVWQAVAQIRIFVYGDASEVLPEEDSIVARVKQALSAS